MLQRQIPYFVVLNGKIVVDAICANGSVRIEAENIVDRARRGTASCGVGSIVHSFVQKKWNVFRQILQNTVSRLVGVNSVTRPDNSLPGIRNAPRKTKARRKSQGSWPQQATIPPGGCSAYNRSRGGNRCECILRRRQIGRIA